MAQEKIYPKGLMVFKPNQNAPIFVKASVVITPSELLKFIDANSSLLSEYKGNSQLRLQLLENEKGLYFVVDTYKKESSF